MLPRTRSGDPCPTIRSKGSFQARWAGPTFHQVAKPRHVSIFVPKLMHFHRVTKPRQGEFNDIPGLVSIFVVPVPVFPSNQPGLCVTNTLQVVSPLICWGLRSFVFERLLVTYVIQK